MESAPALATALGVSLGLAMMPAPVVAETIGETDTEVAEEHEGAPQFVIVGKLVGGVNRNPVQTIGLVGPGFDVELELWPHGLELELAGAALFGQEMTCMPAELLLKKSLHVTSSVDLFAGAGGILNFVHGHEGWSMFPGGMGLVGGTVWGPDHKMGMVLEVTYALLLEPHHLAHEVEAAVGFAYRL